MTKVSVYQRMKRALTKKNESKRKTISKLLFSLVFKFYSHFFEKWIYITVNK